MLEIENAMTEYRAIYKCRLCGEEFVSAVTGNADIAIKHMVSVTSGYNPTEYIGAPITEKTMHSCKGGSMGMADFLGFRKVGE